MVVGAADTNNGVGVFPGGVLAWRRCPLLCLLRPAPNTPPLFPFHIFLSKIRYFLVASPLPANDSRVVARIPEWVIQHETMLRHDGCHKQYTNTRYSYQTAVPWHLLQIHRPRESLQKNNKDTKDRATHKTTGLPGAPESTSYQTSNFLLWKW